MQVAVMIRNKSIIDAVSRKYAVFGDNAIYRYQHKVLSRRLVRNMTYAKAKYDTAEKAQWKDGDVVSIFPDTQKWGKKELRHFLIVKVAGRPGDHKYLAEPITEMPTDSELKGIMWADRPRMATVKRRASYRFEYWNHLDATETEKVRDMDKAYQPFLHRTVAVRDLKYNG